MTVEVECYVKQFTIIFCSK